MPDTIAIADLHPTQLTLGLEEVAARAVKIARLDPAGRRDYLAKKAIPHVIGPGGRLYMVDHHHLARALFDLGIAEAVSGPRLADFADLDPTAFWDRMEDQGWCWTMDADGNRRPHAAIPPHVRDLTDNPWRSLARRVRGRAFEDLDTPFQEFMWGDYFRSFMTLRLLATDLDRAADLAEKLAQNPEAQDLPGFKGKL